eukprot:TRINITY_DN7416_c0_g1_i1.p1 TRINITY_DN7416_c0_g1~~TRINITY_DN7416_c0_g1_i1.p1  ORF type:complete len:577 (-),score=142.60 TRINITY_DN7416_c0_g1_i1:102-1832(-)
MCWSIWVGVLSVLLVVGDVRGVDWGLPKLLLAANKIDEYLIQYNNYIYMLCYTQVGSSYNTYIWCTSSSNLTSWSTARFVDIVTSRASTNTPILSRLATQPSHSTPSQFTLLYRLSPTTFRTYTLHPDTSWSSSTSISNALQSDVAIFNNTLYWAWRSSYGFSMWESPDGYNFYYSSWCGQFYNCPVSGPLNTLFVSEREKLHLLFNGHRTTLNAGSTEWECCDNVTLSALTSFQNNNETVLVSCSVVPPNLLFLPNGYFLFTFSNDDTKTYRMSYPGNLNHLSLDPQSSSYFPPYFSHTSTHFFNAFVSDGELVLWYGFKRDYQVHWSISQPFSLPTNWTPTRALSFNTPDSLYITWTNGSSIYFYQLPSQDYGLLPFISLPAWNIFDYLLYIILAGAGLLLLLLCCCCISKCCCKSRPSRTYRTSPEVSLDHFDEEPVAEVSVGGEDYNYVHADPIPVNVNPYTSPAPSTYNDPPGGPSDLELLKQIRRGNPAQPEGGGEDAAENDLDLLKKMRTEKGGGGEMLQKEENDVALLKQLRTENAGGALNMNNEGGGIENDMVLLKQLRAKKELLET